jgi:signal transduction histidine kinase
VVTWPRTEEVFQVGGLVAWGMVGLTAFPKVAAGFEREALAGLAATVPSQNIPGTVGFLALGFWTLAIGLFLLFGLAFRATTRDFHEAPSGYRGAFLLAGQVVLGLAISTDLLYIVAAEIPWVLRGRRALAWFGAQAVLTSALAFSAPASELELLPGLSSLPGPLVLALSVLSALSWQGLAFSGGFLAASEARRRRELARINFELKATQAMLAQSARAAERSRIGRELHDSIGHHLAALSLSLELASKVADERARRPVGEAHAVAKLLLAEVRSVVTDLRGGRDVELGRVLETLATGIARPVIHLRIPAAGLSLPAEQAHVLFRAAQEAITNSLKHSGAENLWIDISRDEEGLTLVARDDGQGSEPIQIGHGLSGMRERFKELGGSLDLKSAPGAGFEVRGWLPGQREGR